MMKDSMGKVMTRIRVENWLDAGPNPEHKHRELWEEY